MSKIYFDNAATTAMRPEVISRMTESMSTIYGNPSSTHGFGRSAKNEIEKARKTIAGHLNVQASEIIFTSSGTEADNMILHSAVKDLGVNRIITSKIEHHAVLHTVQQLQEGQNIQVSYVSLLPSGQIDYDHLEELLELKNDGKTLVSLMHINNEIGTLLDIKRVGNLCHQNGALFHSDMVQSTGRYDLDLKEIHLDFAAASAHKFHGPKGVGFAFIRKHSGLRSSIYGGEQERGLRAGTEAVHNIIGMEVALNSAYAKMQEEQQYLRDLKNYFVTQLKNRIPGVVFNANSDQNEHTTFTMFNVSLPASASKKNMMLFHLDIKGIACSRGSACQSGSSQVSHVLSEILEEKALQNPSLRFSFSIYNTKQEVDEVVTTLEELCEKDL